MSAKVARRLLYWLPLGIYSGIVFYLSSIPSSGLARLVCTDKIAHLFEFLLWGFLAAVALKGSFIFEKKKMFMLALLLGLVFAFSDEIHQLFVPGREFSFLDITFDFMGLALGSIFIYDRNLSV